MQIVVKDVNYVYSAKTPFERHALKGVNLTINEGDFLGIIGHTGSGKSTFIMHLNGLFKLQSGEIDVFDIKLVPDKKNKSDLRRLRGTVGMVFQYPEYQLFEDTVEKDVAFGPKNMGLDDEEVKRRVKRARAGRTGLRGYKRPRAVRTLGRTKAPRGYRGHNRYAAEGAYSR